jgi:linoleoyl-CoA desaturase
MQQARKLTFSNSRKDFAATLNSRVGKYFKDNNISRHGNGEMVRKTIFMFSLYFIPYFLMVLGFIESWWIAALLIIPMSLGLAGIGLSIMHDANHGAYSKRKWINTWLGYSLNMVGANAFNWKIQHNVLHHTFTNVHDVDEDISPEGVIRMTPYAPWKRMHKFQFVYAWFLYGLLTIAWMAFKDFSQLRKYHKNGLAESQKANIIQEWAILIGTKIIYVSYIFIIPMIFTPFAWWQVFCGVMIMHYIAGFLLSIIFQPAHVVDGTEYPLPDTEDQLENSWTIHQLLTTTNFGNKSRWFSWYVGGLNFQVEHHLFPTVCHVHYRKISRIVKETALEFGVPYKDTKTFFGALRGHGKLLFELGKRPVFSGG